ncbi:jg5700 [Pararge aegeria aegeria]|uniref:Jg5700 protein n=1 Tax=Pararge aegeria aegeria TaxID=348720 RepID=A0A8S4SAX6_9NEOP|nr:jg5700 [Pararge aegeria aegeria]
MIKRLATNDLQRILKYSGHIARRVGDNLQKMVTDKMEGKKLRGSSPLRWSDQIRTALDTKVHLAINVAES